MTVTAGYSGTPLFKKLGIRQGLRLLVLHAPEAYHHWLGNNHGAVSCSGRHQPDMVHLFAANRSIFEKEMKKLLKTAAQNTSLIIWVSWYKKSSGIATNITEDDIRAFALANGLVDVKVCAVSEQWSGLKLVVPLAKR